MTSGRRLPSDLCKYCINVEISVNQSQSRKTHGVSFFFVCWSMSHVVVTARRLVDQLNDLLALLTDDTDNSDQIDEIGSKLYEVIREGYLAVETLVNDPVAKGCCNVL